jgi:hypothetical protein
MRRSRRVIAWVAITRRRGIVASALIPVMFSTRAIVCALFALRCAAFAIESSSFAVRRRARRLRPSVAAIE